MWGSSLSKWHIVQPYDVERFFPSPRPILQTSLILMFMQGSGSDTTN